MSDKWTFFHNGYTWWLRIDNAEQLARYCELTDEERYGGAMMQAAKKINLTIGMVWLAR